MWRYLRWVLAVLVVVILILVALPFMVSTDVYKTQIIAQAKQATGRDLKIDGKLSISFFPEFGVDDPPPNAHHFDGSKGEEVIVQLMGMGPSATTRMHPEQGLFASSKTK